LNSFVIRLHWQFRLIHIDKSHSWSRVCLYSENRISLSLWWWRLEFVVDGSASHSDVKLALYEALSLINMFSESFSLILCTLFIVRWDSWVSIVARLWAEWPKTQGLIPGRGKNRERRTDKERGRGKGSE
jgi:hypothetical protein